MKVDIYNTDKKYNIIYADPPWRYRDVHTLHKIRGGVEKHYKTMHIKEIQERIREKNGVEQVIIVNYQRL